MTPDRPMPAPPINLLVVDDDAESQAVVADALAGPACRLVAAASGTEALRRMLKTDFALILIAAGLRGMDGIELATLIRQVKRSKHIPIIFLMPPGVCACPEFRGSDGGFVDFVAKPVDAGVLQSMVASLAQACGRSDRTALGRVGEELENVIRERTASLIHANDDLRREVARRERAEAELLAARHEAEAANSAKSEFLANMSHEIRTPMNGIVGLLELLVQTPLAAEQREYVNLVKVSAGSLLTIINDILDFSKIEAGSLELERTAFSLRETVGDTMKTLAFEASRKGLELCCEFAPELPDALLGDPVRLRQIITNIVGNAVKFTADGEVALRVEGSVTPDGDIACEFVIRDSGIGIPAEKLKAIFAPFFQGDTSTSRLYGGTGLGLSIAARLVDLMGGSIDVNSAVGEGSVFRFSLRFGRQPAAGTPLPRFAGKRVLAALHGGNRRGLVDDLRHWEAEVVEAETAEAAMACVAAGGRFDLVLLDDALPGPDAGESARRIGRADRRAVVAVLGSLAARRHCGNEAAGGNFVSLVKPVKQSELLALMRRVAGELRPPLPAPQAPIVLGRTGPPLDVLLVEDNAINSRLAQRILAKAGHRVAAADNGPSALALLARRRFDAVLMDVQLPGMDGIEVTRFIRDRERHSGARVPIIALTAHAMAQHRERCLAAGMDGFLAKPIRPQELTDALAGLERYAHRTTPAGPRRTLDSVALLERVGGDACMLAEIRDLLGDKGARLMADARTALSARQEAQAARLLHTLAGMFASLGADAAREIVGRLEGLVGLGQWEGAEGEFRRLESEVERVTDELGTMASGAPQAEIRELARVNP